jgi:cyanophycinase-like exopeptidase
VSGPRLLAIMGSGETTPTMVTPHQRILAQVSGEAVLLDTPYGFQENADDITARARTYFARNVGTDVEAVDLRRVEAMPAAAVETAVERVARAGWVFAGPGSPTYALRQWEATRLADVLAERLVDGAGATVFASAAAVTLGRHAVPVYEIYKVGADPYWIDGLDVLRPLGLDAVVIPHFDNAEGGTHDTRYCYLGERRLTALEAELDPATFVLGVDEHTLALLDLVAGTLTVEGRGAVTVRRAGRSSVFPAGETVAVEALTAAAAGAPAVAAHAPPAPAAQPDEEPAAEPLLAAMRDLSRQLDAALADDDAMAATQAVLDAEETMRSWAADTTQSPDTDAAVALYRSMIARLGGAAAEGLHDHRDVVAPHVQALLDLRAAARDDGDYALADRIRDSLVVAGVEVRDHDDGTDWTYDP